jgi:hypothetical protein
MIKKIEKNMKLLDFCKSKYQLSLAEKDKVECSKYWKQIFEKIVLCLNSCSSDDEIANEIINASKNSRNRLLSYYQDEINFAFKLQNIDTVHEKIKQVWPLLENTLITIEEDMASLMDSK